MILTRWVFIFIVSLIAMFTDIKYGKINNSLNYLVFGINIVFLFLDFNTEYMIALVICAIINLFLVGKLYMGGDAKLMINIAFSIGYKVLYVFIFMLISILVIYIIKIVLNYVKNNELRTANTTKCGPSIFIGILATIIIFYFL